MANTASMRCESEFEVRFRSLLQRGLELIVPCDPEGHVDLDVLSEHARTNYLFARAMVGREYARPAVCRRGHDNAQPSARLPTASRNAQ
jgi:hypothetical protein